MSFTVLPLTQPQSGNGSKPITHPDARGMDFSVGDLLGGSRPMVRDIETKVLDSKIDLKKVAMLWTRGVLPHEISEVMNLSDVILDELMRSEAFVDEVNGLQATREITSLDKALECTCAEALIALRDLMKHADTAAVRSKCAMYIIDQARGKAPQHIQLSNGKIVQDPAEEIARMKKQLGYTTTTGN